MAPKKAKDTVQPCKIKFTKAGFEAIKNNLKERNLPNDEGKLLKSTRQTVIDLKTWRLNVPTGPPLTFEKLVQQNKLQDCSPGLPDKHFKSRMKPISLKEKQLFLSRFNFKPKLTKATKCPPPTLALFTESMIKKYIESAVEDDPDTYQQLLTNETVPESKKSQDKEKPPEKPSLTKHRTEEEKAVGVYRHAYGKKPTEKIDNKYKGKQDWYSAVFGLEDAYIYKALAAYLEVNGDYSPVQVEGNGQCLFEALWRSLSMYDDEDNLGTSESVSKETLMFTPYRLRLMTVYMMVFYCVGSEEFRKELCEFVAGEYGWIEKDGTVDGPGPFSLEGYFIYMMKKTSWGDAAVINVLSLYWNAKIVVVNAAWGMIRETRFRSPDCPLEQADFVLIYNGNSHYSAAIRNNEEEGRYQKCREVAIPTHQAFNWIDYGNDPDPDMADHFKKKKFRLETKASRQDKFDALMKEKEALEKELEAVKSQKSIKDLQKENERLKKELREAKKKKPSKRPDDDDPQEGGPVANLTDQISQEVLTKVISQLQTVNLNISPRKRLVTVGTKKGTDYVLPFAPNETKCEPCKLEFVTNAGLEKHYRFYHLGEDGVLCIERLPSGERCMKELINKAALARHKKNFHSDQEPLTCDECPEPEEGFQKQQYHSKGALKNHKRDKHSAKADKDYSCQFCHRDFRVERDRDDHEFGCKQNPNRNSFSCRVPDCDFESGWLRYLTRHVKDKHTPEQMASLEDLEEEERRQEQEKRRNKEATERAKKILEDLQKKKNCDNEPDAGSEGSEVIAPSPPPSPILSQKSKRKGRAPAQAKSAKKARMDADLQIVDEIPGCETVRDDAGRESDDDFEPTPKKSTCKPAAGFKKLLVKLSDAKKPTKGKGKAKGKQTSKKPSEPEPAPAPKDDSTDDDTPISELIARQQARREEAQQAPRQRTSSTATPASTPLPSPKRPASDRTGLRQSKRQAAADKAKRNLSGIFETPPSPKQSSAAEMIADLKSAGIPNPTRRTVVDYNSYLQDLGNDLYGGSRATSTLRLAKIFARAQGKRTQKADLDQNTSELQNLVQMRSQEAQEPGPSRVPRRQDNRRAAMRGAGRDQEEEKEKSGSTRSRRGEDKDKDGPDAKKKKK